MKRHGNLWGQVVAWENLLLAARKSQRGKRKREIVQRFHFYEESHLLRLQHELIDGSYHPGAFHTHWIDRPKARLISAAPYRDRVVHHAVMNVLEPILDCRFHQDSFACRKGKGTHAASRSLQELMRRNRYAVHCDIHKFFPSIDHLMLKEMFRRLIKDDRILLLLDLIVDTANEQEVVQHWFPGDELWTPQERRRGLPIGNLTSQWLANWYLNDLDYFVTNHRGVGGYVRYCDDFILLDNDRSWLQELVHQVQAFLANKRLRLHQGRLAVVPVRAGLKFVGYRTWSSHRLLPKQNVRQFRRRLSWMKKTYADGGIDSKTIWPRLASWLGHARNANSHRLIERLEQDWIFSRNPGN